MVNVGIYLLSIALILQLKIIRKVHSNVRTKDKIRDIPTAALPASGLTGIISASPVVNDQALHPSYRHSPVYCLHLGSEEIFLIIPFCLQKYRIMTIYSYFCQIIKIFLQCICHANTRNPEDNFGISLSWAEEFISI